MIVLRRLGGGVFALNPDLIERVEATPDTVVTLVDDKKLLIEESLEDVLQLIVDYRAYVLVRSGELTVVDDRGRPTLHVVPNEHVTSQETSLSQGVDLDFSHSGRRNDGAEAFQEAVDAQHDNGATNGNGVVSGVDFGSGPDGGNADGSADSGLGGGI